MKKTSAKTAVEVFKKKAEDIDAFLRQRKLASFSDEHKSWAHDYAIIRLYREFEDMVFNCLVAAINSDTEQLSQATKVAFPKHLRDEVCRYIVVGDGYFDFRGRDGLIGKLKEYLPSNHYLVTIVKDNKYKGALTRLSALRNFAAHNSKPSKIRALEAVQGKGLSSSGAWLKRQNRFGEISDSLKELADEVYQKAPY